MSGKAEPLTGEGMSEEKGVGTSRTRKTADDDRSDNVASKRDPSDALYTRQFLPPILGKSLFSIGTLPERGYI